MSAMIYRATGDLGRAQMLLRHKHISTTQGYVHPSRADLAADMALMDMAWRER